MTLRRWQSRFAPLAGHPAARLLRVDGAEWSQVADDAAAAGGHLVALWARRDAAATPVVRAALAVAGQLLVVEQPLPDADAPYRSLAPIFPAAGRMQRAAYDMAGVRSDDADQRPWLRHAAWPADWFPLGERGVSDAKGAVDARAVDDYPFLRVAGDGVHEIAVGPVHAGIIEPGHFRFSVVGEKVLKLEQRLGYVHKGIERGFTTRSVLEGHRLAARISGDTTVAYAWAYCQAVEGLAGTVVPPRAARLRALCLEIERLQNHLGDLGALGNDAGFAMGLAQFSRLKEMLLRSVSAAFGRRYLFDALVPGGVAVDLAAGAASALAHCVSETAAACMHMQEIYDEHAGVRDRFVGAGCVTPELARRLGLGGMAGRASGQALDLRIDLPVEPYVGLGVERAVRQDGDVAARVALRFDEARESCRLIGVLLGGLPEGALRAPIAAPAQAALGVGIVEGWRGPVLVALDCDAQGGVLRCHAHDPSWQNWPVLEHAIIGNIVPDFPLINKSFNLSYSGHDL
jgi:Ni,Fe-hydrogenase III large subunit